MISQERSLRKPSGGRYKAIGKRKLKNAGRLPAYTGLGERKIVVKRVRGGNNKVQLQRTNIANVFDPKTKQYKQAKIKTIVENPANRHFVRRNIMTKGTVIETDIGKARITSRPGQDGVVNAVLV
jgi:small subunit ribosomal protein S8e